MKYFYLIMSYFTAFILGICGSKVIDGDPTYIPWMIINILSFITYFILFQERSK